MSIKIACPECDKLYTLSDDLDGKRVRCKRCDNRFLVTSRDGSSDYDDYDDEPRAPRRTRPRRKTNDAGVPMWVWLTCGGGALAAVVTIVVVVIILSREPANRPADAKKQEIADKNKGKGTNNEKPVDDDNQAGPHLAMLEEFLANMNGAVNAMDSVRDGPSAVAASATLRKLATDLDSITTRVRSAPPITPAEIERCKARFDQNMDLEHRTQKSADGLSRRMPTLKLSPKQQQDLGLALQVWGKSMLSFGNTAQNHWPF